MAKCLVVEKSLVNKKKSVFLAVFLSVLLMLSSSLSITGVNAESSIPKPDVPRFTVNLIDSSYDIPATSTIDPYTGQTVTQNSSHVDARTIEISIKNQPFTPFKTQNGTATWDVDFCYNIRWKGHFEQDWHELFLVSDGFPSQNYESDYTVLSYNGEYSSTDGLQFNAGSIMTVFSPNSQVDFQVEAMIGYVSREYAGNYGPLSYPYVFNGETSGWSSTQSITINANAPTTTPTPPSSAAPQTANLLGLGWGEIAMIALLSVVAVLLVVVAVYLRKRSVLFCG